MPLIMNSYGEFVDDYDAYSPLKLKRSDAPRSTGRYEKTCPQCFKRFRTDAPNRMYCSGSCNDAARRERKLDARAAEARANYRKRKNTCAVCGREYTAHSAQSKYCSEGCRKAAAKSREETKCES